MSKYQITLTPIDKFFFGGDMTFTVESHGKDYEDYKDYNEQYASYIIRSNKFPQQTSLLGMLRFLVLRNAGSGVFSDNKIVNKQKAENLIGRKSFMVSEDHERNSFGLINGLSHVKVRRTENGQSADLEFAPLFKAVNFDGAVKGVFYPFEIQVPNLTKADYDAKVGLRSLLTDDKNEYELDKVFKEDQRIGINRDISTGKTEDGALFKQISYRFNNADDVKYCFVFDADVDDVVDLSKYDGQMVSIGGDNSQFIIGITKKTSEGVANSPTSKMVCLLSPTFLTREDTQKAQFAVTKLMPFRFLTDRKDNEENDNRSYHILNSKLKRSPKYELYEPGSVFYFKDDQQRDDFIKLIENKKEFRQIGYNEYK